MRRSTIWLALLLLGLLVSGALADGSAFTLLRGGFAGGAATLRGGDVSLRGSIGQAVVGRASGGSLAISSGYWPGVWGIGPEEDERLFLPLAIRP